MNYKCLEKQKFQLGDFKIIPIRYSDRIEIMNWRNSQLFHLRQKEKLTILDQDLYFKNIVASSFKMTNPNQILFSYLKSDKCIGYGGLVHINWIDKNAEISFIIDTILEKSEFEIHWTNFLTLIEEVAFIELKFHKIFTYAFDLRKNLYPILNKNGYINEARLYEHTFYKDKFIDVLIHSKINKIC